MKCQEKAGASPARSEKEQRMELFKTLAKVSDIGDRAIYMASKKLDERVIDITKQVIINMLENLNTAQKKVSVRQAIRSALGELLASTLQNDTSVHDAFQAAVVRVMGATNLAKRLRRYSLVTQEHVLQSEHTSRKRLIRQSVSLRSQEVLQSHHSHLHLGLNVCRPRVKSTAAR